LTSCYYFFALGSKNYNYYTCIYNARAFSNDAESEVSLQESLAGQHGKGFDGLFEKVSFQTAFEGVESR